MGGISCFLEGFVSVHEWVVLAAGLAGIGWVNWYFFLSSRPPAVADTGIEGVQEMSVTVRGGYEPSAIRLQRGTPVRLTFDRQETSGCSEEVVFPEFGIRRFLPAFEKTTVEFTPSQSGTFAFTCGMSMMQGRVEVV